MHLACNSLHTKKYYRLLIFRSFIKYGCIMIFYENRTTSRNWEECSFLRKVISCFICNYGSVLLELCALFWVKLQYNHVCTSDPSHCNHCKVYILLDISLVTEWRKLSGLTLHSDEFIFHYNLLSTHQT